MSPEHRLGADGSISTVTSITEVVISGDLQARAPDRLLAPCSWLSAAFRCAQVAKIYVSFFGAFVVHHAAPVELVLSYADALTRVRAHSRHR